MEGSRYELVNDKDLFDPNKSMRMPICVCIDISNAMDRYNTQLKEALEMLLNDILDDEYLNSSVELGIYVFSSKSEKVRDISIVKDIESALLKVSIDKKSEMSDLGTCLNQCLLDVQRRQGDYSLRRINYYQPHIIVLGAAQPLLDCNWKKTISKIIKKQKNKEMFVIPIAIGEGCIEAYREMSETGQVYMGQIYELKDIFKTVKYSMNKLSQSSTAIYNKLNTMVTDWDKYLK